MSKAYKVIDRFSEDIDLTCDIRRLIGDLIGEDGPLPANRSQASKWTKAIGERLPNWIGTNVRPIIQAALTKEQLNAKLEIGGAEKDKLLLSYPALRHGTGYVPPVVVLEFGGRPASRIRCFPSPATWMGIFPMSRFPPHHRW